MYNDAFLDRDLNKRKLNNSFRQLKVFDANAVDFFSNDYLGLANTLHPNTANNQSGSKGSRLLAGNTAFTQQVEKEIAQFHEAEAALVFNSGYDANVGLLSVVANRHDTIIYDALCHASIRDGIRLSMAKSFSFSHNDLVDVEKKLKLASGNIFIVTEAVFSMDGDMAPIAGLVALAKQYEAHIIIDEAHAIGVIGDSGEGLSQALQLHPSIFARVYTYGKAPGCHGAAIVGSQRLIDYLINFSHSFIYSTALPAYAVQAIQQFYQINSTLTQQRFVLNSHINLVQNSLQHLSALLPSKTAIQCFIVPGNDAVKQASQYLLHQHMIVPPILSPTVPTEFERLRIVLHAFNTTEQVNQLIQALQHIATTLK